jgi:hypothetical protein
MAGKRCPRRPVKKLADWEKELLADILLDEARKTITVFNQALRLNVKKSRSKKK